LRLLDFSNPLWRTNLHISAIGISTHFNCHRLVPTKQQNNKTKKINYPDIYVGDKTKQINKQGFSPLKLQNFFFNKLPIILLNNFFL